MARTAMTELQQQIEAIRGEAFAAGYAAAMEAVRELTSRSAPGAASAAAAPTRRGRPPGRRPGRPRAQETAAARARPARRRRTTRRRARTATSRATTARPAARTRATRRATTRARATSGTAGRTTRRKRASGRRPQRGANAQVIGEILKSAAPRAIPPADIRRALQQRGVEMAFTSIRHALGQLQQRNAAEPVGNSNTWRHRGG
jgi:hypothetical protein